MGYNLYSTVKKFKDSFVSLYCGTKLNLSQSDYVHQIYLHRHLKEVLLQSLLKEKIWYHYTVPLAISVSPSQ